MGFDWDNKKAKNNKLKHNGISFEDAREAFSDFYGVEEYDYLHSINEHRFNLIGMSSKGLLFVVFSQLDEQTIRIISARLADDFERQIYEENLFKT
jgi:hypothetical protein